MSRMKGALAGATLACAVMTAVYAQTPQVQWRQVANTPKGLNLPSGVKADILGIGLGDTYAEATAALARLRTEAGPTSPPPQERKTEILHHTSTGGLLASFVSDIIMIRPLPGTGGAGRISESLSVRFSAPASGHQVVAVSRNLTYQNSADEPRLSEVLAQLKAKFGAEPRVLTGSDQRTRYLRIQYDNGRAIAPADGNLMSSCMAQTTITAASSIASINTAGNCDVVLNMTVTTGISPDHIQRVEFVLSDNERAKVNATADYAFIEAYAKEVMQGLQNQNRAATPRL
ncbi:hypothetical protein [Phreatobacter stygius]|uniref:DUF3313 domain-containing protein n=1 Tax=Phreatobacter stygius TaxID=1940610 RepID=A0A4D7AVU7_9HYPH|nr:hypothetical protein [Phreatobacter stygius]QCI63951.1 hypothetical protein E8M01_06640 [Phreatobacter stygius]